MISFFKPEAIILYLFFPILGGLEVLIDGATYEGYNNLTNQSVEAGVGLRVMKPEENCFEASFPSGASVGFCEQKGMLSIVATPTNSFKNTTKGLLGTWNDNMEDDFTLPDGTVLSSLSNDSVIHYNYGLKCKYPFFECQRQRQKSYKVGVNIAKRNVRRIYVTHFPLSVLIASKGMTH